MQSMRKSLFILLAFFWVIGLHASYIYIPMDAENEKSHLKAYGLTYHVLELGGEAY